MSFTQNTAAPSRSLTAFFDTKGAAQQAASDLEAAGVSRGDIAIVEGGGTATGTASVPEHEGFLASLKDMFMPEEDRYSYAEGLRRGGYLVSVRTGQVDSDRVLDILDRDGAVDMDQRETTWRSEGWTGFGAPAVGTAAAATSATQVAASTRGATVPSVGRDTGATGREDAIPVYEERLNVGKREVSHGRLRVRSYVVETAVDEQVTLRSETVQVDRRPVDRAVSATDAMFQDRTIELEEFAEEAVVSKEARVVEEISLRKEARDRTETIHDSVRHTEVEIEDGRTAATAATATTAGMATGAVREGSDDGRIVEHMEVYASDGTKIGTVDHMEGTDRIKLAKTTSPDGQHHYVPLSWVDHVDRHVHLNRTLAEIKAAR